MSDLSEHHIHTLETNFGIADEENLGFIKHNRINTNPRLTDVSRAGDISKSEIKKISDVGFDNVWLKTFKHQYKRKLWDCWYRDFEIYCADWIEANQTSAHHTSELEKMGDTLKKGNVWWLILGCLIWKKFNFWTSNKLG